MSANSIPAPKTEVVYNGHDPSRFAVDAAARISRAAQDRGRRIPSSAWSRTSIPGNGTSIYCEAFALVRRQHPRAHLVLVGSGATAAGNRGSSPRWGWNRPCIFCGGVDAVIPVVKHFAVGVLCSESEGSSNAVIEYMGCSKPTVCTNVGGNPEFISDHETGFLIDPGDVSALAARINSLLASPALCEAMGHRAGRVAQRLTTERMAESHMNVYERLARPSGDDNRGVRVQCA